jgi:hypothetical protein
LIPAFFVVRQVGTIHVGAHGVKADLIPEERKVDDEL